MKENLKVMFLGGVDEIGKNMTDLEYGDDIIVIDSGLGFPDDNMPGIDIVVPDITYLAMNKHKVRGIFITHGHEDHIGSLPYVLDELKVPLYGSRLALGLVESKMKEFRDIDYTATSIKNGSVITAGCFKVEFISVTHSIPGAMALAITTPVGVVLHTGDFKVDLTPIGEDRINLNRIAEIGKKGVLLLMCESTNAERKGFSMSERTVGKTFDDLFGDLKDKRIFIATFSSNVHRLQQVLDISKRFNRKIAFTGRSMVNVIDTALKIGELKGDKENFIDFDKIDKYEDKELIILTTGSQGESMSAMTRMASDTFPKIKLDENDAIIFSASPIPGNEKSINTVINNLYRKGCTVIYNELADVHVSGHAYQEELKLIHSLVKPKFFIPVHGEYRHMVVHKKLAKDMGLEDRNIIIPELGMQVEVNRNYFKVAGTVPAGERLVDGTGLGDLESVVLRDRKLLSEEGMCIVVVNKYSRGETLFGEHTLISRGFIYQDEASEVITEAKEVIANGLANLDCKGMDNNELKQAIKKIAANFFFKKTKRKPMIISIINEQ